MIKNINTVFPQRNPPKTAQATTTLDSEVDIQTLNY